MRIALAGLLFVFFTLSVLTFMHFYLVCSWFFVLKARQHPLVPRTTTFVALSFLATIAFMGIVAGCALAGPDSSWSAILTILIGIGGYIIALPLVTIRLFSPRDLLQSPLAHSNWLRFWKVLPSQFRFQPGSPSANARRTLAWISAAPLAASALTALLLVISK